MINRKFMELHIESETARLREVVLGLPTSNGPVPTLEETFDSKSYESVLHGIYPTEEDITHEMNAFLSVLQKYDVKVYRPELVENCNQVFARDVVLSLTTKSSSPTSSRTGRKKSMPTGKSTGRSATNTSTTSRRPCMWKAAT